MQVEHLSSDYRVSLLSKKDVPKIYQLYQGNPLYFEHMKTQPTLENTEEDLILLPPGKQKQDKFFVGFWEKEKLIAVLDLIAAYPNAHTAFIGLFMVAQEEQGKQTGSKIICQLLKPLKQEGFSTARLAYVKTNPQSEHFWKKNGFVLTGEEKDQGDYTVALMERVL